MTEKIEDTLTKGNPWSDTDRGAGMGIAIAHASAQARRHSRALARLRALADSARACEGLLEQP